VVVLANLGGRAPEAIASKLSAVAHGENVVLPSERKEIKVPPAILKSMLAPMNSGLSLVHAVTQKYLPV
jgi:hypothetical protein